MKVFLVGGAVRDQLLGLPVNERDWVVIGETPESLLSQGYQAVGRDFPVFLHPETREEYALARTEKKQGVGYYGFICNANPAVTLEEDLARRDLTINAMAKDNEGRVIDPYHGQEDLKHKVLRHVSDAFIEDPVRVLRVARFIARFHHLGFTIAPETRRLMQHMVREGELAYLVAERVWQEWQRSLSEPNPEYFITTLRDCGGLSVVLPEIDALFGVPNARGYHPEVDTGVHSLRTLVIASRLSSDPLVRFASFLHDLGKAKTPMQMWPFHPGHAGAGLEMIQDLSERLRIPTRYQQCARIGARWHGTIHRLLTLSAEAIVDVLDQTAAFRDPAAFERLLVISEADYKGRYANNSLIMVSADYQFSKLWRIILAECGKLTAASWVEQGLVGVAIKNALYQARVACVKALRNQWESNEIKR